MSVVFKCVWPERAERRLRVLLACTVRASAALLEHDSARDPALAGFAECRSAILRNLAEAEQLAGVSAFEADRSGPALVALTQRAVTCVLHLAQLEMAGAAMAPTVAATPKLQHTIAGLLRQAADGLDGSGTRVIVSILDGYRVAHERWAIDFPPAAGNDAALFHISSRAAVASTCALLSAVA